MEAFINSQLDKHTEHETNLFIHETLEDIRIGKATAASFLEGLSNLHSDFDFIGLAVEKEDGNYCIESIHGPNTKEFKGLSFLMGEGFLGHTIATHRFQFWKDTGNDPRINFFNRYGLYSKSLFCIPIFKEEHVAGILFGGCTNRQMKSAEPKSFTGVSNIY
ncbi:GAF domain-containing protein [Halalkalibacter alkalisediminis]|uniref:GAF domain-containing protein n=1 Tax=Halalkalibacter alkalisediminis TaxID=935616 RepID=A0ABV6NEV7_9BACI|nr:hypothetical protein [Halalkalibacter alkalisediminis]